MFNVGEDVYKYTYETLRRYVIEKDCVINNADDLLKIYITMKEKGYFYAAVKDKRWMEVKKILKEFSKAFEEDRTILDNDLR